MNRQKLLQAAKMIGFKSPLVKGKTFVGRQRELSVASASLMGSQVTSLWVWGPRKIGKTSLSLQIPTGEILRTVRASCDRFEWQGITPFLDQLAEETRTALGLDITGSGESFLHEIGKHTTTQSHIIFVFDEFDQVAVNLQQYEQALLRSTLQNNPFLGIVFITRLRPTELLQDYSDENSRLLGICDIIRVPMLSQQEVTSLTEIAADLCSEVFPSWLPSWIYERVGGHPVCVQGLLREFLIFSSEFSVMPTETEVNAEEYRFFEKAEYDLQGLWKDIPFYMRERLISGEDFVEGQLKREFMAFRLFRDGKPLRPAWLSEIGKQAGLTQEVQNLPELFESAEMLNDTLRMCNEISLRSGKSQVFQVTQQFFRLFQLVRPVADEIDLNNRINVLHKICVENTNSDKLPKGDRCLIPKEIRPIYKKSDGFRILVAWRNFCSHDPSHDLDPGEESERYTNIGQICGKYLGPGRRTPGSRKDCNLIYKGILNDVLDSVKNLKIALEEFL